MDNNDGSLGFKVTLDNSQLAIDANKSKNILKGIGDSAVTQGNVVQKAFNNIYGMVAVGGAASIALLGKQIITVRGEFQQLGIAFETMLGSKAKADKLMQEAVVFAAKTPFTLSDVATNIKQLMAMGIENEKVMGTMKALGDVAAGVSVPISRIAINYGQVATQGKLMGRELRDFNMAGIPLAQELAKNLGVAKDKIADMVEAGQIGFPMVEKAFQSMAGEGGKFYNLMEKQNLSVTGQISNLTDKLQVMYNEIGKSNEGLIYGGIKGLSSLVSNYKAVGEVVGGLIAIYGAYKVATMVVAYQETARAALLARNIAIEAEYTALMATQNTMMMGRAQIAVVESATRVTATNTVIAAEERLAAATKASSLANTYVLAAIAVAALGYAIYEVVTYQTDLEKATKKAQFEIENEKDKAAQLFAELNHAKEGTDGWKKAKQGILDQYGTYLTEQQKELNGVNLIAEAYKNVNSGIEENIALKVKQESLDAISQKFNDKIVSANQGIQDAVKKSLGRDRSASVGQDIAPLIANVKIAVDKESRDKATKELQDYLQNLAKEAKGNSKILDFDPDVMRFRANLLVALKDFSDESLAINNAFDVQQKKIEAGKADPILTTYKAQLEDIKKKKAIAEKELEALKTTPGENPMKAIADKQAEIDEFNKQLGIKEKKEKEGIKSTVEASKEYIDIQNQILAKIKELDAANSAKNTKEGLQLAKEITALEKKRDLLVAGGEKVEPLGATVATKIIDAKTLAPMKQLTDEQKKQLELKGKQANIDATIIDGAKELKNTIQDQSEGFYNAADAASYIAQQIGESNKGLADMLQGIANIAGQMGDLAAKGAFSKIITNADGTTSGGMSKTDAIGSVIGGATQMIGMFVSQAAENKRVMEDYYASVIKQQNDYNLSLNEQLRLNTELNGSIFFNDFKAKLSDASKALTDATDKKNKAMSEFYGSEAIVGKKNVVSAGNVLGGIGSGAALGAGVGALIGGGILSLPAAAAGAIIGGVVGAIGGLFAKKKKDIVAPLLETYPLLIKANGDFNAELAKTLIANEKVTTETKATLQNVVDWEEAAKKANEQITGIIEDMVGTIGSDLRNALVDAFEGGTNAAVKFGDAVNGILEDILSQSIFNAVFGPALDKLQADLDASAKNGGDLMTPIRQFLTLVPGLTSLFNSTLTATNNETKNTVTTARGMTDAEKENEIKLKAKAKADSDALSELYRTGKNTSEAVRIAQANISASTIALADFYKSLLVTTPGLDLFGGTSTDRTGTTKGIAQASQDSIDELNGRATAIQGHTFRIADGMDILKANSTAILNNVIEIKGHTLSMQADMKSVKVGIDNINLKGITLKN